RARIGLAIAGLGLGRRREELAALGPADLPERAEALENEVGDRGARGRVAALSACEGVEHVIEAIDVTDGFEQLFRRGRIREIERAAVLEPRDDGTGVDVDQR